VKAERARADYEQWYQAKSHDEIFRSGSCIVDVNAPVYRSDIGKWNYVCSRCGNTAPLCQFKREPCKAAVSSMVVQRKAWLEVVMGKAAAKKLYDRKRREGQLMLAKIRKDPEWARRYAETARQRYLRKRPAAAAASSSSRA
jgi:hypothetical protein